MRFQRRGRLAVREQLRPAEFPGWSARALAYPLIHALMGVAVLLLDLLSGPFLLFPVLFVLPVSLCAWFSSTRWAYALAVLLPAGRFVIAVFVETSMPLVYAAINLLVRVSVLLFLAFLVGRTARQTKALQERVSGLVTVCAWSRTVEYQGEWISFEEYLQRRFKLDTSHGISPDALQKALEDSDPDRSNA